MIRLLDSLLNRITMYRLLLYFLIALLGLGLVLGFVHVILVPPDALLSTVAIYLAVCVGSNAAFAKIFHVDANKESSILTALIMSLISGPVSVLSDPVHAGYLALAGIFAVASKYLLALRKQHLFNPAAFGIFLTGVLFGQYSTWWVGSIQMLPLVALGGVLVLRKVGRFRMVGVFIAASMIFLFVQGMIQGLGVATALGNIPFAYLRTEILFAAVVMLTEPLTSPKRFDRRAWYAVIAAFFFLPQLTIFGFTINPETALLIANLFSFIVSPSFKLDLRLREQTELAPGIFAFNFRKPKWLRHKPGQFMEFTIPVKHSDDRGNRRYFSIASSPTEDTFMFAARFPDRPSAYKRTLEMAQPGDRFIASELSGDFMLPKNRMRPLAFIAGGIGITPFRGMIKYLSDSGERRDVVLFYSNYRAEEIVFDDVLREARDRVGLRVVHTLTDCENVPKDWCGKIGFIDDRMIAEAVPDYDRRHFMISGSLKMVEAMRGVLRRLGVPAARIQTDFFPGYTT